MPSPKIERLPQWAVAVLTRRSELGLSQEEFAFKAGISPSLVTKIETGKQHTEKMRQQSYDGLLRAMQWTRAEFETAAGLRQATPLHERNQATLSRYRILPVRSLATAGLPLEAGDTEYAEEVVPLGDDRPGLEIYIAEGESMTTGDSRSIHNNDVLYVDTRDTDLKSGEIYILRIHGNGVAVKRARLLDGQWYLFSDNPEYQALRPDAVDVLGRVYQWRQTVTPRDLR